MHKWLTYILPSEGLQSSDICGLKASMGVLGESWCFCNGGGKSERTKASIYSGKGPAMARISTGGLLSGTGFLIHRNLLLTTHAILPSVAAVEAAEIRLQNGVGASLFPHRFFITSSILDLTIVGLDSMDGDSNMPIQQPHYLKTCSKPALNLGNVVYILGYTEKNELTVGDGKVVIATDNLIKVCTDGVTWSPGSAGFDAHGNISFMVCDPMKLATSPNTKSSSTSSSSSSSWKKDLPMQFGIPIPIICDWLNQNWEGNLDDLVNKPKLPLIRLMSTGQRSEQSCTSFTMRQVFKTTEPENDPITPSNMTSKSKDQPGPSSSPVTNSCQDETPSQGPPAIGVAHVQGIPTPEIYESPKLTSVPFRKNQITQIQLLDINFPPKIAKPSQPTTPVKKNQSDAMVKAEIGSMGSVNGTEGEGEVEPCSSPSQGSEGQNGYISEGETTMYSAETAESRNYPSPKEGRFHQQQVGRSQSCVNHNRWGPVQSNSMARGRSLEKQRSYIQGRKVFSQGATSNRSNDYYSPTVSSIMKKRNNLEQQWPNRPRRPSPVRSSPKWAF